jgi:hypothetical protein
MTKSELQQWIEQKLWLVKLTGDLRHYPPMWAIQQAK